MRTLLRAISPMFGGGSFSYLGALPKASNDTRAIHANVAALNHFMNSDTNRRGAYTYDVSLIKFDDDVHSYVLQKGTNVRATNVIVLKLVHAKGRSL